MFQSELHIHSYVSYSLLWLNRNKFHDYCEGERRKVSGDCSSHLSNHTQGMEDYKTILQCLAAKA